MKYYILYILCFIMYSCDSKTPTESEELKLPNDLRWVTNSYEYKILCEQTYENAWNNLAETLKAANSQSVIIMDLDETVLDNSKYQIDLTEKGESYNPESWSVWVNQKEADLVPGAKKFIDLVRSTNVRIVFLSNRMAKNELPTIENMEALNIYEKDDIFMLRIDKPDKKHIHHLKPN